VTITIAGRPLANWEATPFVKKLAPATSLSKLHQSLSQKFLRIITESEGCIESS
jgi:hypothetical protein